MPSPSLRLRVIFFAKQRILYSKITLNFFFIVVSAIFLQVLGQNKHINCGGKNLEVAIIGSGVSGLSCAFRLNQHGVKPTLFERRSIIGEAVNLCGVHLNCFNMVSDNPLRFFEKNYNLKIEPMCTLKEMVMCSADKKVTIKGNLGYILNRGPGMTSIERQLFDKVDAYFYFDTYIMGPIIDDIRKQFDAVVIATGCADIPKHLGVLKESVIIQVRSGIFDGNYKTGQIISWMKTEYSNNLFAYLIPITENRAVLTLLVDNVTPDELDYMWKKMLIEENITNNILETWEQEYDGGRLKTNQIGNIYFVGNAGGLTDDFMGFGIVNAIASGIFAADAIVGRTNYQESLEAILKRLDKIHNFKLLAEKIGKDNWKHMTQYIGMPVVRNIIYKTSLLKFHHMGGVIEKFISK